MSSARARSSLAHDILENKVRARLVEIAKSDDDTVAAPTAEADSRSDVAEGESGAVNVAEGESGSENAADGAAGRAAGDPEAEETTA